MSNVCQECEGLGIVTTQDADGAVEVTCPSCEGSGIKKYDPDGPGHERDIQEDK